MVPVGSSRRTVLLTADVPRGLPLSTACSERRCFLATGFLFLAACERLGYEVDDGV